MNETYQHWLDYIDNPHGPRPGIPIAQPQSIDAMKLVTEPANHASGGSEAYWTRYYQLLHGSMLNGHTTANGKSQS